MSTMLEGDDAGGLKGPSEVSVGGAEAILKIAGHLAATASGPDGKLLPEAAAHLALRNVDERREFLEQVIREVCPNGVDLGLWRSWILGGRSPFEPKMRKVGPGSEGPSRTLARSTPRVRGQEKKIDKLRAELEAEERELELMRSYDNAAVHWVVVDQLVSIMSPAFAMGPAWTIMRSLSGHLSEALGERMTGFLFGKEKETALKKMRADRVAESEAMLATMDFFSGNLEFEEAFRRAASKLCKEFDGRREELVKDGRRPRGAERLRTEVHPKARDEAAEVLGGLKRAS